MKKSLAAVLVLLAIVIAPCAFAQDRKTTTITRVDTKHGSSPVYAAAILRPAFEVWVFGIPDSLDIEVGRLFNLAEKNGHSLNVGGYLAYVADPKDLYLIPWVNAGGKTLGGTYSFNVAAYVPLTGGTLSAFMDDSSIMWGEQLPLKLGISGTFWVDEGQSLSAGLGPKLSYEVVDGLTLSTRYVFKNRGENVLRFALTTTF